ncbi:DUF3561 family protein [Salmonella enterica subsp. enterica serovar Infantis]|nr:DUF3561 family protein [Salmonella enterica subsp. enterica serovar Infantis]
MTPPVHFRGGGRLCVMAAGVGILFCFMALTRCFFLYTALFLALMPVSVIIGIALHLLVKGKILFSIMFTLLAVGALFGALFIWLLGRRVITAPPVIIQTVTNNEIMFSLLGYT